MNNYSTAGIGVYVKVVAGLLAVFGVTFNVDMVSSSLQVAIPAIVYLVGETAHIYGQLTRKDLSMGIKRK